MVAEAAHQHKLISPWLIPYFSKKRPDVVEADDILRPVPHSQVSAMTQDNVCALLKRLAVKLV